MRQQRRIVTVADYLRSPHRRILPTEQDARKYRSELEQNLRKLKQLIDQELKTGHTTTVEF
jgi:hypothetical protein